MQSKSDKKPFNKRAYFNQKYKKNYGSQQEGHGRALLQKRAFVRQYYKEKRWEEKRESKKMQHQERRLETDKSEEEGPRLFLKENPSIATDAVEDDLSFPEQPKKQKTSSWKRARLQYRQKIAERENRKEEALQKKKDIELAKAKRKEVRLKRFKKLNQKTKKGQPVMRGRIELMLEQLEKEMS